ncbi:sensor histidine kinase [Paenibacillus sp. NPDC058071]|uniref:sensor histidine kinase n=1 Tax=Paenibacillus sp. NPDC058071 TaxID=3346326 RepID=UPI0036DF6867
MSRLEEKYGDRRWFFIAHATAGVFVFCLVLAAGWGLVYFGMNLLYGWIGWEPTDFWKQILHSFIGLFLIFGVIRVVMMIGNKTPMEINSTLDAMRRIAKGDFKVRLDIGRRNRGPFETIMHEINHMAVELDEMEQLRQAFISDVSHEIQTPLTSISGFARALQNDSLPQETRRSYLRIIESESVRLSRLSDNLLKLSSLESDHHPFEPKAYRLDRQLGNLILSCEPQWTEKRLEMNVDMDEVLVFGDEDLLSQVWINLLGNAIKFTPEGGRIDVRLSRDAADQSVRFRIADNGIGIPEESRELVFQRFYKADKARSRKTGGSGLGLSLAKKIVDMHKGHIFLESEPGQGAAFTVILPPEEMLKQKQS